MSDTNTTPLPPKVLDAEKRYNAVITELYRSFDFFNKHFCKDKLLPRPIITVASKGTARALGWFGSRFWTDNESGDQYNEINLSAEYLKRPVEDILETLLHEMAHLKNNVNGISDCNRQQRHNKHFKESAEFFGLIAEKYKNKGFAVTKLDIKSREAIQKLDPDSQVYRFFRAPEKELKVPNKLAPLMVLREIKEEVTQWGKDNEVSARQITEDALLLYFKQHDTDLYDRLLEIREEDRQQS